ncbi:hypothetical protein HNP52_003974 [Sphingomonas kyeonggiensis]|uniref:Uncharacterized protein n=1 Tax=Sphingomonas kyeonggiensis TaxID=1268553 RepID=A0A7W7K4G9_9SPHN|nr:hypothetical protein [Sphingomonas kyeonggiensis]MBB4840877.1 hypothetical protein [Sphingomonas kyeonggiensis]
MMFKKGLTAAVAAIALAQPGPAIAQAARATIRLNDGLVLPYMRLVRFWEASGEKAMGDTPNERAPGQITRTPGVYVHGNVSKADAGVVERKLKAALDILLAQTPLRDIRGASIRADINISRGTSGQVQGSLRIAAYPINLSNPKTKMVDGRYATPGEGSSLMIWYNAPLHDQSWDRVQIVGEYDGIKIQQVLVGYAGLVVRSNRQLLVPGRNGNALNPKFFDTSRPAGDLQLLWFYPSSGVGDREAPTKGDARVAAAGFMADWNAIVRRMEQIR